MQGHTSRDEYFQAETRRLTRPSNPGKGMLTGKFAEFGDGFGLSMYDWHGAATKDGMRLVLFFLAVESQPFTQKQRGGSWTFSPTGEAKIAKIADTETEKPRGNAETPERENILGINLNLKLNQRHRHRPRSSNLATKPGPRGHVKDSTEKCKGLGKNRKEAVKEGMATNPRNIPQEEEEEYYTDAVPQLEQTHVLPKVGGKPKPPIISLAWLGQKQAGCRLITSWETSSDPSDSSLNSPATRIVSATVDSTVPLGTHAKVARKRRTKHCSTSKMIVSGFSQALPGFPPFPAVPTSKSSGTPMQTDEKPMIACHGVAVQYLTLYVYQRFLFIAGQTDSGVEDQLKLSLSLNGQTFAPFRSTGGNQLADRQGQARLLVAGSLQGSRSSTSNCNSSNVTAVEADVKAALKSWQT
ncbi:hypothetical protein B0H19DRAFT_1059650 [Mycena capillaripes]|nr:hypothetical protein B0H19DRAFT_1059650 [Mycena capillaripes]